MAFSVSGEGDLLLLQCLLLPSREKMLGHHSIPLGSKSRASQLIKVPLLTLKAKTSPQVRAGPDDTSPLHGEDSVLALTSTDMRQAGCKAFPVFCFPCSQEPMLTLTWPSGYHAYAAYAGDYQF